MSESVLPMSSSRSFIVSETFNTVCETGQRYRKDDKNVSLCLNVLKEEISIKILFQEVQ